MFSKQARNIQEISHPFFSKWWNSYDDYIQDLKQYERENNIIFSIKDSRLLREPYKSRFKYEYCKVMCKHGARPKSSKIDNSRPNQHTYHTHVSSAQHLNSIQIVKNCFSTRSFQLITIIKFRMIYTTIWKEMINSKTTMKQRL